MVAALCDWLEITSRSALTNQKKLAVFLSQSGGSRKLIAIRDMPVFPRLAQIASFFSLLQVLIS